MIREKYLFFQDGFVLCLCSKGLELSKSHELFYPVTEGALWWHGQILSLFRTWVWTEQILCVAGKKPAPEISPATLTGQIGPSPIISLEDIMPDQLSGDQKWAWCKESVPQVTWECLMKGNCLHNTADTEAVKLEDSWSGDQRALKVLKLYSCPHPLQIWLNAYKSCYCLQYFTLLMEEFWNLLSIWLFYHQLLNYCWGRFIHSPSYHKYPGI